MAITQHIDLNLIPNSAPVVVHVDQYDHGTGRIIASLYEDSTPYTPSAASVYVQGTKPDGKFFVSSDGVTLEGNVVTADLTEVMTQVAGQVRVQFVVTEQTGRTGTFVFWLDVQASALPDDSQMSESDISMVEEAIETMQGYVSDAAESAQESAASATASSQSAEDSEAWAVGTRNGAPVPPTDPTYHNNSKYWAEHGGGGSGDGHIIMDSEGNDMPRRASLQFLGMTVEDDAAHGITKVTGGAGGSVIKVHTSEASLHGEDVTLSDGTDTLTAAFDSNGDATFGNVMMTGTLTLSSTDGTDTATGTLAVPYYGQYNIDISFWSATIQISTSTSIFNGLTVSAKKDGVVYGTGTFTNGSATINVPEAGTYTLECTYDWKTYQSDPVVVSAETTYSVTFNGFAETVNVVGESAFANMNITISCSGMPTQTKQLDANAELTYLALQPGTYTFTINYQGTPYSVQQAVTTGGPFTVNLSRWTATLQFSTSSAAMDGQTIYVSLGGTVVGSATFSNGSASLDVHSAGTYEVSCTVSGFPYTKEVVVSQETTYNVTLNTFDATVNISTSSSQLYGASIQIKKNGVNYATTAFDNTGSATYVLHETGTYSFECTYGGQTYSSGDVVVSAETTYTTSITMGLDLSAWISAGSTTEYPLNPASYANFAALEADEAAVMQLMYVHNAVDYLATATAGDTLMGQVINSNICAKWINICDYAFDTLSANADIAAAMATADKYGYGDWIKLSDNPETWGPKGNVPIMTANNAPYGVAVKSTEGSGQEAWRTFAGDWGNSSKGWCPTTNNAGEYVGYQSPVPICVKKIKIGAKYNNDVTYSFVGSNDGSTWEDIKTNITPSHGTYAATVETEVDINSDDYYMYHALKVTSGQIATSSWGVLLQLYGRQMTVSIPTMTGNTSPYGEASISPSAVSGYDAYKAFDGDLTTGARPTGTAGQDFSIEYDFGRPFSLKCIYARSIRYGSPTADLTAYLQYYDADTSQWIDISTYPYKVSAEYSKFVSGIDAITTKVRLKGTFTLVGGDTLSILLTTLQAYGFDYSEKEFATGSTRKTIYDHGVELVTLTGTSGASKNADNIYLPPSNGISTPSISMNGYNMVGVVVGNRVLVSSSGAYIGIGTETAGQANAASYSSGYSRIAGQDMPNNVAHDIQAITESKTITITSASGVSDYLTIDELWLE